MYGISIFLGEEITNETRNYIQKMSEIGFKGIFTSLHIPEDDATLYSQRLRELGLLAQKSNMKLMVDISGEALTRAGYSFERLEEIVAIGVTGLRMDYAISNKEIAEASHYLNIGLNASTITTKDVEELRSFKADFTKFEAWHNYYPRPETGLSSEFFKDKNRWLQESGFQVFAFVPGNKQLRAPLYEGLPTLEKHRYENPFSAAIELKENYQVAGVYLGDPGIAERTMNQFDAYNHDQLMQLEVESSGSSYYSLILGTHVNRQDEARDVVRSAAARFKEIEEIKPEALIERKIGSITIDNLKYGRYMGEIQIAKKKLPANEKINVVAQVVSEDCSLLKLIRGGKAFTLIEKGSL
ncbi:DUF871 domain-containing protein [Enterococcus caccae]|uniref:Outer surface protein n=1 Tax=Enterococcus caccae ATCC BAA-1240 TaxID=1158612 RepID=R3W6F1_9ENTE|nr:MupG family TIM beta-alpha barrel fold protein [Enterococcus caccae]EOL43276.1 hypothetical protein UC7_02605 [Enterococcus caccae ATCC BAA-1240]EOT68324.1 hypothetical protein I580_00707 [Enterococcus caccae ATCC BAA-1240]OJG26811.1 hypothetical protein RU98_GL003198 [Enterococcus caccae]